jgi:AcrR family transcriptional regulator
MALRQPLPRPAFASQAGRIAQKRRTRNDLLRAAQAIRERGEVPTVAQAADEAGISRATAYRYFPAQEALLAEASTGPLLAAVADAVERAGPIVDVVQRVDAVFAALAPVMLKHEAELRTLLKISLERSLRDDFERDVPLRSDGWILAWDEIFAPIRSEITSRRYATMVRSLATLLGIESIIILKDACDNDAARTVDTLRSAARAMVIGFLEEIRQKRSAPKRRTG